MKIVRNYKKDSKHQWWKIILKPLYGKYSNVSWYHNNEVLGLEFSAYGFSSKRKFDKGIRNEYGSFEYVGKSREEVISKEKELLRTYYDYILKLKMENVETLKKAKKRFKKNEEELNGYLELKEFKIIERKEKLESINGR